MKRSRELFCLYVLSLVLAFLLINYFVDVQFTNRHYDVCTMLDKVS